MALAENQGQRAKLEAPKQKVRSEAVTGSDFIIELSCRIDNQMKDIPKPGCAQANQYESALVWRLCLRGVR